MQVSDRLVEFRGLVKNVVRSACRTALLEAGFTPDDYFYDDDEEEGNYCFLPYGTFSGVFPSLDCVSGTLCLSHYVTEI